MSKELLAICPYCGQIYQSNNEDVNDDLLKVEAIKRCNCPDAIQHASKLELIEDTVNQLRCFFKQTSPEVLVDADVLESIRTLTEKYIPHIADGNVLSASIEVIGVGKITFAAKGSSIKIKHQTVANIKKRY